MIIRQFLLSTQDSSAGRRADAAAALARAYLHGNLAPDTAWQAKTALLALLDDPSALVRRALAEACASSTQAPRALIVALASDEPDVACLVLARSPVLLDADLVDAAAIGCERARTAIAGRSDLSRSVAAALAEVAGPEALIVLAGNFHAEIGPASFLRMIERHGDNGRLREALLKRHDTGIEVRQTIAARMAESLADYSRSSGWISPERGERIAREARECATLSLGDEFGEAGLARLVGHLRREGQLNSGLILRAVLSLRIPFAEAALADLSGMSRARVAGLFLDPSSTAFAALIRKSGLPTVLLSPIQAALTVWCKAAEAHAEVAGVRLARHMIEAALETCEALPFAEGRGLMALLSRFEAEAAREEARGIAYAVATEAPVPALEAPSPATFPVDAILEELPEAIVASYRAGREQSAQRSMDSVLDELQDGLMASFLADRASALPATEFVALPAPSARPREIALALAATMIPSVDPRDRFRAAA